jgi:hypothetical protein
MDLPQITPDEERTLRMVIEKWETRTPLQQAIATAVLRITVKAPDGVPTPDSVAAYLKVSVDEVRAALPGTYGLLLDRNTQKIWIR